MLSNAWSRLGGTTEASGHVDPRSGPGVGASLRGRLFQRTREGGNAIVLPFLAEAMPYRSHRVYATHRLRVSKIVEAPLRYVYEWSTDYRSDDWRLSQRRPSPRFRAVHLSARRVLRIRVTSGRARDPEVAVDLVRLEPPNAWHTDQIDESDLEAVDYKLTRLGPGRTRLDLCITERWMVADHLSRADTLHRVEAAWDRYALAIEARYRSGRPAKG